MEKVHKVSLVIPCYRDSATLGRALDSVLRQTRPVDEIIVVNDCSPETEAIEGVLRAYPSVTYVRNPANQGLAATRNKGAEVASGDVITFLDADDELHPQKVELQLSVLREGCAVTCGVLGVAGTEKPVSQPAYSGTIPVRTVTHEREMLFRNTLTGAAIMLPRKLLMQVGGYDANLRSCEDFDLWLRLLGAGVNVCDIRLPLYVYHYNANGLSKNFSNISYWELEVLKKYFHHNNQTSFGSFRDASVWAFWMIKHLARYEICKDETLRARTMQNIALLSEYPFLRGLVSMASQSRLLRLYALLR